MDYDILINSIVSEVLRRLENQEKTVLVMFTGGSIGFNQSIKQLNLLKAKGWNLRVFLSKSAEKVLTPELVSKLLKVDNILLESKLSDEKMLLKNISAVIIPVLTMNSAVKIALGIADTIATHTAASAIMCGIPIIAAKDACDPRNKERLQGNFSNIPSAYARKINSYLSDLRDFGLRLVEADVIFEAVSAWSGCRTVKKQEQQEVDKRLITREDIMLVKNKGLKEIYVAKNAIITALAKDAGRELGVEIKCI